MHQKSSNRPDCAGVAVHDEAQPEWQPVEQKDKKYFKKSNITGLTLIATIQTLLFPKPF
jgi:hypothetical protein